MKKAEFVVQEIPQNQREPTKNTFDLIQGERKYFVWL